jgi:hypothetical protein
LDGFVSQIAAHLPLLKEHEQDAAHDLCKVYVTINRDNRTDKAAQAMVEMCQSSTSTTESTSSISSKSESNKQCQHIRLPPRRIVPSYFANRIQGISLAESKEMAKVLAEAKILGKENGELINEPRQSRKHWNNALRSASASASSILAFQKRGDSFIPDRSPIFEVLNVEWGFHEISRDGVREALEFCVARQSSK